MTYSWLLHGDEHTLELSAICELEKHIWMESLSKAIQESKELYSNSVDSNEYLLEQLFVSSFDQHAQPKFNGDKAIEAESPIHFPMPGGSTSFSQSAIFNKPARSNNRSSQPIFGTHEFSVIDSALSQNNNGAQSPGLRSQSSISDLREFFSNSVSEKWSQRKFNQYHTRCKSVDTKFDDVCTTPILTARANSMNRHGSTTRRKIGAIPNSYANSSVVSLVKSIVVDSTVGSPIIHSPSPLDGASPIYGNLNGRRPSVSTQNTDSMIFRLAQRNSYLNRSNSVNSCADVTSATVAAAVTTTTNATSTTAGLLPPSNSVHSLSNRPTKFFGRMVEKLGQIGTPGKLRRNNMMSSVPSLVNSSSSSLSSKPPTLLGNNSNQKLPEDTPTTSAKKKVITLFTEMFFVY